MKHTKEQIELSESLLAACKAAGIEKPQYIAQDQDGTVLHHKLRPTREGWNHIFGTGGACVILQHPSYAGDWRDSLLEWVEPKEEKSFFSQFTEQHIQYHNEKHGHLPITQGEPLADVLARHPDHVADTSKKVDKYTVEPHGKGYAVYLGRDSKHHGANLAHLSECSPAFANQIQALLNGKYTTQVNHGESDDACKIAYRAYTNEPCAKSTNKNMKDEIQNLNEEQLKVLLELAMEHLEKSVYAETHYDKMTAAANLGFLSQKIKSESNKSLK